MSTDAQALEAVAGDALTRQAESEPFVTPRGHEPGRGPRVETHVVVRLRS